MSLQDIFAPLIDVNQDEIADWVPPSVLDCVKRRGILDTRVLPLLHDERMKSVWRELSRHGGEKSCGDFFGAMDCIMYGNIPVSRAELEKELQPLRETAAVLRKELETEIPSEDSLTAKYVAGALEHIERRIQGREQAAFIVARGSKLRGKDDATRVFARRVVGLMQETVGSPLYGTSATVTSVMTGARVTRKEIENWTKAP